jgi:hypothetical protein
MVPWNEMDVRDVQPKNALSPIFFTLLGIVIEIKLEQSLNDQYPILVTLLGMVIEVKLEHS